MGAGPDIAEAGSVDRGVTLGGREAGVAEEFLDRAEVSAGTEQVGGKAMPERVGRRVFGEAGAAAVVTHCLAGDGRVEAGTAGANEERGVFGAGGVEGEPGGHGVADRGEEGDDALLAAFAEDAEAGNGGAEGADIEGQGLGDSEAGAVEEREEGGVAGLPARIGVFGADVFDEGGGFGGCEGAGRRRADAGAAQERGRWINDGVVAGEVVEQTADGGEMAGSGGVGGTCAGLRGEPGAEIGLAEGGEVGQSRLVAEMVREKT